LCWLADEAKTSRLLTRVRSARNARAVHRASWIALRAVKLYHLTKICMSLTHDALQETPFQVATDRLLAAGQRMTQSDGLHGTAWPGRLH